MEISRVIDPSFAIYDGGDYISFDNDLYLDSTGLYLSHNGNYEDHYLYDDKYGDEYEFEEIEAFSVVRK